MARVVIPFAEFALEATQGNTQLYSAMCEGRKVTVKGKPISDVTVETEATFKNAAGETITFFRVENAGGATTQNSTRNKVVVTLSYLDDIGGYEKAIQALDVLAKEKALNA